MAEVSYLHLHGEEEDEIGDVLFPYWSHDFDGFTSDLDFPPSDFRRIPSSHRQHHHRPRNHLPRSRALNDDVVLSGTTDSISIPPNADLLFDRGSFVMDLFHQRVEQSSTSRRVNDLRDRRGGSGINSGLDDADLDLGLGLGFTVDVDRGDDGFMVADCGDEFFVSRRRGGGGGGGDNVSESSESSSGPECFMSGLRVVGSDSEEVGVDEEGFEIGDNVCDDDVSLRLCWDAFRLDDDENNNNNRGGGNEDFEWEEVDGGVDEREVLSMFFDGEADDDASVLPGISGVEEVELGERRVDGLEWEVLLNVHNLEVNPEFGRDGEQYDEYNYAEYEMFFGQFADNENASMGRPPASKAAVKNLVGGGISR